MASGAEAVILPLDLPSFRPLYLGCWEKAWKYYIYIILYYTYTFIYVYTIDIYNQSNHQDLPFLTVQHLLFSAGLSPGSWRLLNAQSPWWAIGVAGPWWPLAAAVAWRNSPWGIHGKYQRWRLGDLHIFWRKSGEPVGATFLGVSQSYDRGTITEDWTRAYFGAENLGFPLPVSSVWSQSSRFPVPERPADDQAGGNGGAVLGKSTSPKNGDELHDQVGGFSQIFLEFQPGVWSAKLSSIVSPLAGAQIEQCSSWGVEDCSPSLQKKHQKTAGQRVNGKSRFHP